MCVGRGLIFYFKFIFKIYFCALLFYFLENKILITNQFPSLRNFFTFYERTKGQIENSDDLCDITFSIASRHEIIDMNEFIMKKTDVLQNFNDYRNKLKNEKKQVNDWMIVIKKIKIIIANKYEGDLDEATVIKSNFSFKIFCS